MTRLFVLKEVVSGGRFLALLETGAAADHFHPLCNGLSFRILIKYIIKQTEMTRFIKQISPCGRNDPAIGAKGKGCAAGDFSHCSKQAPPHIPSLLPQTPVIPTKGRNPKRLDTVNCHW